MLGPEGEGRGAVKLTLLALAVYGLFAINVAVQVRLGLMAAGDSNLPTLYLRAYLTFSHVRVVGDVEGVTLYREQHEVFRPPAAPAAKPDAPAKTESKPAAESKPAPKAEPAKSASPAKKAKK